MTHETNLKKGTVYTKRSCNTSQDRSGKVLGAGNKNKMLQISDC